MESENKRINIISTGTAAEAIDLQLNPFIQLGHVIDVTGKTRKGTPRDGERQRDADGELLWAVPVFHAALAAERTVITVTPQTAQGGVNTQQEDCDSVSKRAKEEASPTRDDCGRNTTWRRPARRHPAAG